MSNTNNRLIPKKAMICVVTVCTLFISLVFTGYAEDIVDENNPYEAVVKGTVYDGETKLPIQDAVVIIEYHEILRKDNTDSNGQYIFNHVPECFCLKNMTASKAGYMTQEIWVAVGDVTVVDFFLNPFQNGTEPTEGGIVTGWVTDADTNKPIEEAEMTIAYHESIQVEYTDSNGQYIFENVPICFCLKNISATKKGYESQYQLIAVSEETYMNFSLEPLKDPQEPKEPEEPEEPKEPDDPEEPEEPEESDDPEEPEEPGEPEEPDNPEEPEDAKDDDPLNGVLKGFVIDGSENKPISNVLITLKYHDIIRKTFTDSNGKYSITNIPICYCLKNLSASKIGYESQYQLVAVSDLTYANFSLNRLQDNTIDSPDSAPNPDVFRGETNDDDKPFGLEGYSFAVIGFLGTLVVLLVTAIYVYLARRKVHK